MYGGPGMWLSCESFAGSWTGCAVKKKKKKEKVGRPSAAFILLLNSLWSDSLSTQHKVSIMKCRTDRSIATQWVSVIARNLHQMCHTDILKAWLRSTKWVLIDWSSSFKLWNNFWIGTVSSPSPFLFVCSLGKKRKLYLEKRKKKILVSVWDSDGLRLIWPVLWFLPFLRFCFVSRVCLLACFHVNVC